MVASSSAANYVADNEKRKKQTIEKVKVNHLSRQLQMRLQYARLKVEHGWQKQNLNEVENLYFHNSHLRGSKPYPGPTMTTAQSQSSAFQSPQMSPAQSRLSFRFGSTPIQNSSSIVGLGSLLDGEQQGHNGSQGESSFPHSSQETSATPFTSTVDTHPSISVNMTDASSTSAPTNSMSTLPSATPPMPSATSENPSKSPDDPMVSVPEPTGSPHGSQSPIDVTQQSVAHYYATVKSIHSRPNKVLPSSRSQISLTAKDMYNFGTSSPLTYDSFWSAHSGSNTPRSTRSPLGFSSAEYQSAFQVPGNFTSGVQENSRATSTSILSRASTFGSAALQLEAARNPTGHT